MEFKPKKPIEPKYLGPDYCEFCNQIQKQTMLLTSGKNNIIICYECMLDLTQKFKE